MKNSSEINFFILSLGCPKNQVDLEYLSSSLGAMNWKLTMDPQDADVSIINTCAFINDAKEESIEMIFEMLEFGPVIITGCLPQLYKEKLRDLIPEVSIFAGTESSAFAAEIDRSFRMGDSLMLINRNDRQYMEFRQRIPFSRYHTYIKISEGCNRNCAYCIIPQIRGPLRSRSISEIKKEIEYMYARGFREFELISEDAALYGVDRGKKGLINLIEELDSMQLDDMELRMMYIYPDNNIRDITDAIADSTHFIRYMDVPFQHTSKDMLKRMNRPSVDVRAISQYIRNRNIILRTSLMTGFPGESRSDYLNMKAYIKDGSADRIGIFKYSDEENAASFSMSGKLSSHVLSSRYRVLYSEAMSVLDKRMQAAIGTEGKAVFHYIDGDYSIGRLIEDAPDIDPICICRGGIELFKPVEINIIGVSDTNYICEVKNGHKTD